MKIISYFIFISLLACGVIADDLYNVSSLDESDNIYEYTLAINTILENGIGISILLIISVVSYVAAGGNYQGIGMASFMGALTATIMLPLGFIPFYIYQLVVVLAGVGMVVVFLFGRD